MNQRKLLLLLLIAGGILTGITTSFAQTNKVSAKQGTAKTKPRKKKIDCSGKEDELRKRELSMLYLDRTLKVDYVTVDYLGNCIYTVKGEYYDTQYGSGHRILRKYRWKNDSWVRLQGGGYN